MSILAEFFSSYFLWRDPVMVAAVSGLVCGLLGVYVVLKRIVFISAALAQISGFGVVLMFFLQSLLVSDLTAFLDPFIFSVFITILSAVFFSLQRDFHPVSIEGITGFVFLISSSLIIVLSDKIAHSSHEINGIIFGNAVTVDPMDLLMILGLSTLSLIINVVFYKDFMFISYDPETARLYKYPVRTINLLFFTMLAVIITVTTKVLGSLTVFSLLVLPGLSALYLSRNIKTIFLISSVFGMFSGILGYFFSFVFSLPTGATITLTASIIFITSLIRNKINGN